MLSLWLTGVMLGCLACRTDGVGGIAAIHPLHVDGLGPELPASDLTLPAPVQAPADGLFEGDDQSDGHRARVLVWVLNTSGG